VVAQATVHGYTVAFWWAAAIFAAGAIVCRLVVRRGAPKLEPDASPALAVGHEGPPTTSQQITIPTADIQL
jgi:hypothetical protein